MHLDAEEGEDQPGGDHAQTPLPQSDGAADSTSATETSGAEASTIAADSRPEDVAEAAVLTADQEA